MKRRFRAANLCVVPTQRVTLLLPLLIWWVRFSCQNVISQKCIGAKSLIAFAKTHRPLGPCRPLDKVFARQNLVVHPKSCRTNLVVYGVSSHVIQCEFAGQASTVLVNRRAIQRIHIGRCWWQDRATTLMALRQFRIRE